MARKIPEHHIEWFDLLIAGATNNQLALMDCTNPDGEDRTVICIFYPNEEGSNDGGVFVPIAEMCENKEPFTHYTPPMVNDNDNTGNMEENVSK